MTENIARPESPDVAARPGVARRLLSNPLGLVALLILAIVVLTAIIGPWVAPFDPGHSTLADAFKGPGDGHLLGTDSAGRDVFSRLIVGARTTLLAGALAVAVSLLVGVPSGLMAGFYGGWFDAVASWCTNLLMSLPAIIVLLAASAALGNSVWVSMGIFGLVMSPGFFRLTRSSVQTVRNELYVDAARVAGLSDTSIISKHILFVVRAPIIIQASIVCGIAISIQATLEFLGLGDMLVPTWGVMLNEGFVNIYNAPLLVLWPALAISFTIGSFVVLGNALRDVLEDSPKAARTKGAKKGRKDVSGGAAGIPDVYNDHLLTVTDLAVGYPQPGGRIKTVVANTGFHLDRGEILGIVGESGSGKTQTAFSILGLLPDDALITHGSIVFDGTTLVSSQGQHISQAKLSKLRGKRIAYIPQEPMSNLDPNFKVGSQLVFPMVQILKISKAEATKRALELLTTVGIANPQRTFDSYPHEISGGMAQRVLIAGAVSCNPDLLIADEPTTALDVTVQAEVLDLLRDLQSKLGMGIVIVTHNFGVVADLCDRVVVMQSGRLVESGDVRTLLRDPSEPYTKALLGAMLEGKATRTRLTQPERTGAFSGLDNDSVESATTAGA